MIINKGDIKQVKKCLNCGAEIGINQEIFHKCGSNHNEIRKIANISANDIEKMRTETRIERESSAIGIMFKVLAVLIWSIGGLVAIGIFFLALSEDISWMIAFPSIISVILSGMFFYGFGEIICLLKDINENLRYR